ncbi:RNA polymerase sigma-70 factor (ECF subfamily) [Breznakibacter xylanolyticus]|uniref:RNA polymerase sigma-70 factor (ECF subfamily) n=1 Tax=Breznakibacter xylanolyticus TaxID=990 RepID=A0A2W7MU74_9BACT|nr:RNA polymerase sigma-70 factor [Breznakibacter xylanolyticus]PZX11380.1 RNA polymerase sigma-70 factor (ECF subfamily) [Breznakibacter xylanolyticus]
MNDQFLIDGLARGDHGAYEALFMAYYTPLVVFAVRMVDDEDTARELVQDIFVSFYERNTVLSIHTSLKSHLYQSVRNRCLNHLKREKLLRTHHQHIFDDTKESESYFENAVETSELQQRLYHIIAQLPDKCKEVFEMSRFEGFTNQEIADKLAISKRTVETQISKALKFLRDNLSDYLHVITIFLINAYCFIINIF